MGLVILDRDGVINLDSPEHIRTPDDWEPIPGSPEAIARLNQAGYRVVVATNQSGIGRKLFDIETLNRIHDRMRRRLAGSGASVESVFFCPHRPKDGCGCRKPLPGLLTRISERLRVPLAGVPVIGDSASDVLAARAAGARPILVLTGNGERALRELGRSGAGLDVHADLAAAAKALLEAGAP